MTETPWLLTEEVAAFLRVDREWVSRQCAKGALKATKLGQHWRIHRDDLDAFMGQGQIQTPRPGRSRRRAS